MIRKQIVWATLFAVTLGCMQALAAKKGDRGSPVAGEEKVNLEHGYRASSLIGMKVMNKANEEVGKIEDLVINPTNGRVRYAAVGVGGFLGVNERYFAVPWQMFSMKQEGNKVVLVSDLEKDRLRNAPGFDKNNWPEFGTRYGEELDKYYNIHVTTKRD